MLKFTQDGKFVAQYGKAGQSKGSNETENFGRVAKIFVDAEANEAYLADGYGNKRVAVLDADTGAFKRLLGRVRQQARRHELGTYDPDAPLAQQFRKPVHCADLSNDGFVYVCDRPNNRLQVFTREGKFVKERTYRQRLSATAPSGTSRFRETRSSGTSSSPMARTSGSTS